MAEGGWQEPVLEPRWPRRKDTVRVCCSNETVAPSVTWWPRLSRRPPSGKLDQVRSLPRAKTVPRGPSGSVQDELVAHDAPSAYGSNSSNHRNVNGCSTATGSRHSQLALYKMSNCKYPVSCSGGAEPKWLCPGCCSTVAPTAPSNQSPTRRPQHLHQRNASNVKWKASLKDGTRRYSSPVVTPPVPQTAPWHRPGYRRSKALTRPSAASTWSLVLSSSFFRR